MGKCIYIKGAKVAWHVMCRDTPDLSNLYHQERQLITLKKGFPDQSCPLSNCTDQEQQPEIAGIRKEIRPNKLPHSLAKNVHSIALNYKKLEVCLLPTLDNPGKREVKKAYQQVSPLSCIVQCLKDLSLILQELGRNIKHKNKLIYSYSPTWRYLLEG